MLKFYFITYDLRQPGRDYKKLSDAIAAIASARIVPLESFWIVQTKLTASQIRDQLRKSVDANDKLLVGPFDAKEWAGLNLTQSDVDWLNKAYKVAA